MKSEARRRGPLGRFWPGVKYFQGNRSPNDAQRKAEGCSTAWLHHKGRNRHHLEYWIDYDPAGTGKLIGNEMPVKCVAEMLCDRLAASRDGRDHYILHPNTRALLEKMLLLVRDEGEEKAFAIIRREILHR